MKTISIKLDDNLWNEIKKMDPNMEHFIVESIRFRLSVLQHCEDNYDDACAECAAKIEARNDEKGNWQTL